MEEKTYHGWANYETWATAMWLDNDAATSVFWNEQARDCWESAPASHRVRRWNFTRLESARLELAERLKRVIHEQCPELGCSLYADLIGAALSKVRWFEIASGYIEELADETA